MQWKTSMSDWFTTVNGVRQGGILSPKLFNIYMDGLSSRLIYSEVGCNINGKCVNHLMYADDLTLLSPSAKGMQKLLDICQSFAIEFDILYNTTKSVCLYFESKKFKLLTIPYVMLDGKRIEYVDSYKLLGMVIENSGSDKKDIARQIRSLYFRANMLVRKFSSCSYQVKRQLFMSYCTNLYCVQLWSVYILLDSHGD